MMGASGNHSALSNPTVLDHGKNDLIDNGQFHKQRFFYPTIVSLGSFAVSLGNVSLGGGVSIAAFDFAKVAIGEGTPFM